MYPECNTGHVIGSEDLVNLEKILIDNIQIRSECFYILYILYANSLEKHKGRMHLG